MISVMDAMVASFVLVSVALTLLPGPDLAFVIRNGAHGRGPAIGAALGTAIAALAWGAAAGLGVSALLEQSARAFEVVKLAGAAYLMFLGLRTLWQSRTAQPMTPRDSSSQAVSPRSAFGRGICVDLLNPKTGLFYVAVVPQVIPHGMPFLPSTLLFAGIDAVIAAGYLSGIAIAAAALLVWLRRPAVTRGLERTTGLCMVGLGIRTALERA
jgi:threonine/homoserine/homoserine lactone efflux protein